MMLPLLRWTGFSPHCLPQNEHDILVLGSHQVR